MTILTLTTRLLNIFTFCLSLTHDGLTVGYLGFTCICLHAKLSLHTVDQYLQVKLSHT
jgi:hypothetical protein